MDIMPISSQSSMQYPISPNSPPIQSSSTVPASIFNQSAIPSPSTTDSSSNIIRCSGHNMCPIIDEVLLDGFDKPIQFYTCSQFPKCPFMEWVDGVPKTNSNKRQSVDNNSIPLSTTSNNPISSSLCQPLNKKNKN
mmetsp:Transcript_16713/g.21687  ORF Transcript_16713/g.21687 Transcript_16713/m.21687 type:complete len:136 (-) Transcript_16713:90-497(-)